MPNQVRANLAKKEPVEEKPFRSDRAPTVIFICSCFMLSSNYEGKKTTNTNKQKKREKKPPNKPKHIKKEGP